METFTPNEAQILDQLALKELERLYNESLTNLNPVQVEQLEKDNCAMILQFPKMTTAWTLRNALEVKRAVVEMKELEALFMPPYQGVVPGT